MDAPRGTEGGGDVELEPVPGLGACWGLVRAQGLRGRPAARAGVAETPSGAEASVVAVGPWCLCCTVGGWDAWGLGGNLLNE